MTEEDRTIPENEVSELVEGEDLESLKQALAKEREKAERYLANWQRAEADFRNYKMREEQEKKELINWANSTLVCDILPVLDAFDRAFQGISNTGKNLSWVTGFKQIQRMLLDVLNKHGVTEMRCLGEIFDPSLHEAVAQGEGEEGMIIEEVRKGYRLKDKMLRAPQVVVGKGGQVLAPEASERDERNLTDSKS